jgi:hypothetical protein
MQPGGQTLDGPSLANKFAGCAQITMADAAQKVSFMIRIAILFDNMFHPFALWLFQRGQDAQRVLFKAIRSTELSSAEDVQLSRKIQL